MKITQALLDDLTAKAKVSPRLRMNMGLRDSAEDTSQRMLNAIEPGSPLPIHRHQNTLDFGCITPLYVYRMLGGAVSMKEISTVMDEIKKNQ